MYPFILSSFSIAVFIWMLFSWMLKNCLYNAEDKTFLVSWQYVICISTLGVFINWFKLRVCSYHSFWNDRIFYSWLLYIYHLVTESPWFSIYFENNFEKVALVQDLIECRHIDFLKACLLWLLKIENKIKTLILISQSLMPLGHCVGKFCE